MCDIVNDVLTVVIFIIIVHVLRRGWGIWGGGGGWCGGVGGGGGGGAGGLSAPPPPQSFLSISSFFEEPFKCALEISNENQYSILKIFNLKLYSVVQRMPWMELTINRV